MNFKVEIFGVLFVDIVPSDDKAHYYTAGWW